MSDNIRISTTPGGGDKLVNLQINQKFDFIEILSLKISQDKVYRRFCSDYGVVVGRVTINNSVGVPNAKVSVFIPIDEVDAEDTETLGMYPYKEVTSKDPEGIPYNLLPRNNRGKGSCFTPIGTFPSKREIQDNPLLGEVYCKYYKFTTTTNNSGDFMIFGLPVGTHFMHVDADISDIGILSQKPYDLIREGVPEKSFKSSFKFKGRSDSSSSLIQLKTNSPVSVTVPPFWGDTEQCDIGIARSDVDLATDIVPTAIFMGSIVSDNEKHSLNKKCKPRKKLGQMDEVVTGDGTIEMIRKTLEGGIEPIEIEGGELIDGNGAWAYQIPMNLDYRVTAEDGTLVPSGQEGVGIPTSARVRFKIGMAIDGDEGRLRTRAKYLVPHNPDTWNDRDFNFGTSTNDGSFADLSWNNIYTVKNHITRAQPNRRLEDRNFIGFKHVDNPGSRNPLPFNKMDTNISALFSILCVLMKIFARLVGFLNISLIPFINILLHIVNGVLKGICVVFEKVGLAICALRFEKKDPSCRNKYCIGEVYSGYKCKCSDILDYKAYISLSCDSGDGEEKYIPGVKKAFTDKPKFTPAGQNAKNSDGTIIPFDSKVNKKGTSNCFKNGYEKTREKAEEEGYKVFFAAPINHSKGNDFVCGDLPFDERPPSEQKGTLEGCDAGWSHCQTMQLAESMDIFKFDFYNDWINGTLYLFLLKYKQKRKSRKEKFCEVDCKQIVDSFGNSINPDSDNRCRKSNYVLDTCTFSEPQLRRDNNKKGVKSKRVTTKFRSGYIKNYEGELYYSPITAAHNRKLFATDIVNLGSIFDCSWNGDQKFYQYLTDTSSNLPPLLAEYIELENNTTVKSITGYDGLFGRLECNGFITNGDNCNNIKRMCELGFGLDERREDDTGIFIPPNDEMGNVDIEDPFVRGIFTKLNSTVSSLVEVKIDNASFADYQDLNYNILRAPNTSKEIWVYGNSYYFYFGLNKGKTALAKMKRKFFTECIPELDVDFFIVSDSITPTTETAPESGAISINIFGGIGPYTFTWTQLDVSGTLYPTDSDKSKEDISGLISGTYSVEVIDSIGNKTNGSFIVPGPSPVGCNVQSTNVTEFSANDGKITVNLTEGIKPYTVELFETVNGDIVGSAVDTKSLTITEDSTEFTDLSPRIDENTPDTTFIPTLNLGYRVVVEDSTTPAPTRCQSDLKIDEPTALSLTLVPTNMKCNGDEDGQIIGNVTGGVAPYTFTWTTFPSDYDGDTDTKNVLNAPKGGYTLKVIDNAGQEATASQTITEPDVITFTSTATNGCTGKGELDITAIAGGTKPYTIKITNGAFSDTKILSSSENSHTFINLDNGSNLNNEGSYDIVIEDGNGCTTDDTTEVFVPATKLKVSSFNVSPTSNVNANSSSRTFTVAINGGIFQDNSTNPSLVDYGYKIDVERDTGSGFVKIKDKDDVTDTIYTFTENYSATPSLFVPNPTADPEPTPGSSIPYIYRVTVYDKNGDTDGCSKISGTRTVTIEIT
tara:strand:+ start:1149 stop:5642 length:4494 start_codon:yes stop_codon:yes gene_type:complete